MSLIRVKVPAFQFSLSPVRNAFRIHVEIIDRYVGVKAKFFRKMVDLSVFLSIVHFNNVNRNLANWLAYRISKHIFFDSFIAIDNDT